MKWLDGITSITLLDGNGHELEQTLADGEGQGGLVCCCPWGHRVGHAWVPGQQQQNTEKVMETGWGRLHL